LYRCVQVHDRFSGIQATQRKEELQMEKLSRIWDGMT